MRMMGWLPLKNCLRCSTTKKNKKKAIPISHEKKCNATKHKMALNESKTHIM